MKNQQDGGIDNDLFWINPVEKCIHDLRITLGQQRKSNFTWPKGIMESDTELQFKHDKCLFDVLLWYMCYPYLEKS
jgi:hypothetical protein